MYIFHQPSGWPTWSSLTTDERNARLQSSWSAPVYMDDNNNILHSIHAGNSFSQMLTFNRQELTSILMEHGRLSLDKTKPKCDVDLFSDGNIESGNAQPSCNMHYSLPTDSCFNHEWGDQCCFAFPPTDCDTYTKVLRKAIDGRSLSLIHI